MKQTNAGFTLVEVMVAVIILTVGLLALAGATANVTKMVSYGKWATRASQVGTQRLETLRQIAASTSPACTATALQSGGPVTADGITEQWTVVGTGTSRTVRVIVTYPKAGRNTSDTLVTLLRCQ